MTELEKAKAFNAGVKAGLETVLAALNPGQRQKLMKEDAVRALFERYGMTG